MSEFGYGQQDPSDGASEYNALAFVVTQLLGRCRTMVLVQVKAVTNEGGVSPVGFVDAQPMVSMLDGQGNATSHGTVFNLPYFRLQGGTNAVIIDPEVGDIGLAVIADRDISAVKENREPSTPGSLRRFDLADGVYIGGVLNGEPEQYVSFTSTGMKLADKNGNEIEMDASGITMTGNLIVNGTIASVVGGVSVGLRSHLHTSAAAGNPTTAPLPNT